MDFDHGRHAIQKGPLQHHGRANIREMLAQAKKEERKKTALGKKMKGLACCGLQTGIGEMSARGDWRRWAYPAAAALDAAD